MENIELTKKPNLDIFDQRFPARLREAEIYDPTKFTILTGDDGVLDDLFSYQVYNKIKNHWRAAAAPADKQPGMIRSDSDDDKVHHYGAAAWDEVLQLTRSSDVSPYFANLYLAEYIYHTGDLDTYFRFETDRITIRAGGTTFITIHEAATDYLTLLEGLNFIGDSVNTKMTQGLTINQGAYDDEILAFKSSDIAHGMTSLAETDTYGFFQKVNATAGGLRMWGFGEATYGIHIDGMNVTDDVSKDTGSIAPIVLQSGKKSGTGGAVVGADANLVVMRNYGSTRWILDEDGDSWQLGMVTSQGLIVSAPTELTIAAGVITVTKSYHTVDGQGDADDDLVTINGGIDGMVVVLRAEHVDRDIQILETGNIKLVGANWLSNGTGYNIVLIYDATLSKWVEISRSYAE